MDPALLSFWAVALAVVLSLATFLGYGFCSGSVFVFCSDLGWLFSGPGCGSAFGFSSGSGDRYCSRSLSLALVMFLGYGSCSGSACGPGPDDPVPAQLIVF